MTSEKFRAQLRQEAIAWRDEGIISPTLYDQFSDRYGFDQLDTSARNRFVMILLGLGSVLIALAVITFVAANWQAWSRAARVVLLVSLFIGINSGGFYLWRGADQRWQARLGQALLLLGGLLIGPFLALLSQMFHQTGSVQVLYLVWGLAVLAMAYSLRLSMLGILSMLLVSLGYFWYYPDPTSGGIWLFALNMFPLLAIALYIPLARWCRSYWLMQLSTCFIALALQFKLIQFLHAQDGGSGWATLGKVVAAALPPLLLWGCRALPALLAPQSDEESVGGFLAITYVSLFSYLFSFNYWWRYPVTSAGDPSVALAMADGLAIIVVFSAIALFLWWKLGTLQGQIWRLTLADTSLAAVVLVMALTIIAHDATGPLWVAGTLIFNILLAVIAIACIRDALSNSSRRGFWWGVSLLSLQILSRTLEYNTGLLTKSLAFLLCGIGMIMAGLWFERYIRVLPAARSQ